MESPAIADPWPFVTRFPARTVAIGDIRMNRSLKPYQGQDIRNVALVGHAHSGKTTLISALLQAAKMTERLGRVDDGSAVTAYDEEDVARRTTMQNALAFAEWQNLKINFVDTPGFPMSSTRPAPRCCPSKRPCSSSTRPAAWRP